MNQAAKALVGVQFALGGAVAAYAASTLVLSGKPGALSLVILLAAYVPYAGVGSVLVTRRPRNLIGWVLLGIGWTFALSFLPIDATTVELQTLTASPLQMAIVWFTETSVSLVFALIATLAFSFPTGGVAAGRWRPIALLVLALVWAVVVVSALWPVFTIEPIIGGGIVEIPNPIGLPPLQDFDAGLLPGVTGLLLPLILVASIVAIAGRYRGARDLERLQLRWLVAVFGFIAIAVLSGFPIFAFFDPAGVIAWVPASVAFMLPPFAIGVAVTRYRLYEIDRLISRGLSWAVLSGLLLAVYGGAVLVLQGLLGGVTQGDTVAVAGSTLLAAALFQPLRRRIQGAVDQRFNRARYDAERTAIDFAERLRGEVDLSSLSFDIAGIVHTALQPTMIGVWIRRSGPTTAYRPTDGRLPA
jgi:hypothetical protein